MINILLRPTTLPLDDEPHQASLIVLHFGVLSKFCIIQLY